MSLKDFSNIAEIFNTASWPRTSPNLKLCFIEIAHHLPELYTMTLRLITLSLKGINYVLHMSQILIMTVPCCYKVLVFMLVAILLLIDFTNFAKAENYPDKDYNYDRYQYPDYQSSMYIFYFSTIPEILQFFWQV